MGFQLERPGTDFVDAVADELRTFARVLGRCIGPKCVLFAGDANGDGGPILIAHFFSSRNRILAARRSEIS